MNILFVWIACSSPPPAALDLSEPLSTGEVRAGLITSNESLFGGISAEGQPGDFKLYNDRVQFILQGDRDGDFYVGTGGAIVDADIVRPSAQPGRDMVDEWVPLAGLGRLVNPEKFQVKNNGAAGVQARVRVSGGETPMKLLTGALGSESVVPDLGLSLCTDFTLEPDTPLLEVTTHISTGDQAATLSPGDLLIASLDAVDGWNPGTGLEPLTANEYPWTGFVGHENEIALGIFAPPDEILRSDAAAVVLQSLTRASMGLGPLLELPPNQSASWTRFYGVGRDFCELTDAWLSTHAIATKTVEGVVESSDGPVGGARVNVLVDEAPFTLCFTQADGSFSAQVPEDAEVRLLADGRGTGIFTDLPDGHGPYSPYAADNIVQHSLDTLAVGAPAIPAAQGRGAGTPEAPLVLGEPGTLHLQVNDNLPFTAFLSRTSAEPTVDPRLVVSRPSGGTVSAWALDGSVSLQVEPGEYTLVAHRGIRYEYWSSTVEVVAGEEHTELLELPAAYELENWLIGDPHTHASPSNDGGIPMEDRLAVTAGSGVQVHFGTDHDHVANYQPLLQPMGLQDVLFSVVADEASPLVGHINAYPLELNTELPNHGAWRWWSELVSTTEEITALLREKHPGVVLQMNHPLDSGVASAAGWTPGKINRPERWSDHFDAVEVLNASAHEEYTEFFLDVVARGIPLIPVGVSDSHTYTGGQPGLNVTFLGTDTSAPAQFSNDKLRETMKARRTIASMGPFLELSLDPGSEWVGAQALSVTVKAPTWIQIDQVHLLENGEPIDSRELSDPTTPLLFDLSPSEDAFYVVVAEGDQDMSPVYSGKRPWAFTSPIYIDVDGDGWTPPLPALELAR
ncbi:MAG: CehA/McbA family metallohydrolase [Myxococcota bacterium]|nr:CehA/McbA family metallohydrolase [Myxococcota bacterium]